MSSAGEKPWDVIARRELSVKDSDERVVVELGRPYALGADFACPFKLSTNSETIRRDVCGVDAFQALHLALRLMSSYLHHDSRRPVGKMFLFEPDQGIGFADPEIGK